MGTKNSPHVNTLLRTERLRRGWSQQDLANLLGTTIVTVNRWERGIQQPSPVFCLKLCTLFHKSEEELGLDEKKNSADQTIPEVVDQEKGVPGTEVHDGLHDKPHLSHTQAVDHPVALADLEAVFVSEPVFVDISLQSTGIYQDTSRMGAPGHKTNVPSISDKPKFGKRNMALVMIFIILCGWLLSSYVLSLSAPFSLASHPGISPTQTPYRASSVRLLSSGQLLYAAQWSKDRDGWPFSSEWHWSEQDGGMLMTDSMTNSIIAAPYHVSTSSYAIEASIQRLSYTDLNGNAYGIVIGMTSARGDICGVGIHEKPEHFFIGQLGAPVVQNQPIIADDVLRSPVALDTAWHVYRVEVTPTHIRFLFDRKLIGEITNDTSLQSGQIGLYAIGTLIRVRQYTVFAM